MSVRHAGSVLVRELRLRVRALRHDPAINLVIMIVLAFGIGATTMMFSVTQALLLQPLPFWEPDRLVRLWVTSAPRGVAQADVSAPTFQDWRQQQGVFAHVSASEMATFSLTGNGDPERVAAAKITPDLIQTLGVSPVLGRGFLPEEARHGAHRVALIGYGLWQRRFGGDAGIVNRSVPLNGEPYTVVGVMPPEFDFPRARELWTPLVLDASREPWRADRTNRNLAVVARLASGVTVEQARADMNALAGRLAAAFPGTDTGWGVRLLPFYDWMVPEPVQRAMLVLLGASLLLLLLACANVANLLLARGIARRREIATHAALGASRARIVWHLLTESLLLAGGGAVAGVLLTMAGTRMLGAVSLPDVTRLSPIQLNAPVLAFAVAITVLTGFTFGIVPAWWASQPNLAEVLKTGGRPGTSRSARRLGGLLVAAQIGLTVTILISAGLLARSFLEIRRLPLGFSADQVLTFQINLPGTKYGTQPQRVEFYDRLLERLRALPAVAAAGGATHPPLAVNDWKVEITIEGLQADARDGEGTLLAEARAVTPGYFKTVGIPVTAGREFSTQDRGAPEPRLLVSQTFVRRFWPDEDPIGKRFRPGLTAAFGTVVGVVADVRGGYREDAPPACYLFYDDIGMPSLAIAVRAHDDPARVLPAVRAVVREIDPGQPIYNVKTMTQVVTTAEAQPRFQAIVLGLLALAALVLAGGGTYSMVAYLVRQQRRDIAVRMALGADRRAILRMIFWRCLRYVLPGLVAGLAASLMMTRFMASLLFRTSATDALTFALIPLALLAVASVACYLPAHRAVRANPVRALQDE